MASAITNTVCAVTGFEPAPVGGYFGFLPGQTPALMRGGTGSFLAAALVAMPSPRQAPSMGALLGCSSVLGTDGWSLVAGLDVEELLLFVGAGVEGFEYGPPMLSHGLLVANVVNGGDGALEAALFLNGVLLATLTAGTWVDPDAAVEFAVGNSQEDLAALGCYDAAIAAFGVGPALPMDSPAEVEALLEAMASLWKTTERAADILDLDGLLTYAWSARRGLAHVVDGGRETWSDWKAGQVLHRLGTEVGMSTTGRDAQWMAALSTGMDVVPLSAALAFSGLYEDWLGDAGKTIAGGFVTDWVTTAGSAAPATLSTGAPAFRNVVDGPNYVQLSGGVGVGQGTLLVSFGGVPAFVDVNSDGSVAVCMSVQSADPGASSSFALFDNAGLGYVYVGYFDGNWVAGYADSAGVETVIASLPASLPEVAIAVLWSDGPNIKARINGGPVGSYAWVGQKWGGAFADRSVSADPGADIMSRVFEPLVVRGAYAGDGAWASWRAYCGQQYGYTGN